MSQVPCRRAAIALVRLRPGEPGSVLACAECARGRELIFAPLIPRLNPEPCSFWVAEPESSDRFVIVEAMTRCPCGARAELCEQCASSKAKGGRRVAS